MLYSFVPMKKRQVNHAGVSPLSAVYALLYKLHIVPAILPLQAFAVLPCILHALSRADHHCLPVASRSFMVVFVMQSHAAAHY